RGYELVATVRADGQPAPFPAVDAPDADRVLRPHRVRAEVPPVERPPRPRVARAAERGGVEARKAERAAAHPHVVVVDAEGAAAEAREVDDPRGERERRDDGTGREERDADGDHQPQPGVTARAEPLFVEEP